MINAIIVDDEPLAQDILETYLERIPEIELIAKCDNAFEANDVLKKEDVDLMFLDINMPQLTGTDFLRGLTDPPVTIFTTAYPNYALDGFELNALDYLVKPISMDRFLQACNRAVEQAELKQKGQGPPRTGRRPRLLLRQGRQKARPRQPRRNRLHRRPQGLRHHPPPQRPRHHPPDHEVPR